MICRPFKPHMHPITPLPHPTSTRSRPAHLYNGSHKTVKGRSAYAAPTSTRQIRLASLTAPAGAGKMGPIHYIDASRTRQIWLASLTAPAGAGKMAGYTT